MSALVTGSQYRFMATLTRNGSVWDLTGATVTLSFKRPDATTTSKSASLLSAAAGQVNYDSETTLFDQAGTWTRSWTITLASITYKTVPIQFTVVSAP